ncbi:hypothetical protein HT136_10105 [Novosphingobium profundi]|uniref:DUF6683 family protein n=1 Tax=Novosphingobium profundi TaxID=1774954 RepID=UPI001BDA5EE1|nr:DUF6683 family protein [Novosphingobium profundi]MBT0668720.1 hypothetical protein [Novosphingobium profundi]
MIAFRQVRSTPERARRAVLRGLAAGALLLCAPGHAQFYVPEPNMLPMSSFLNDSFLSNQALKKGPSRARPRSAPPSRSGEPKPDAGSALTFRGGAPPVMPARLAATVPAPDRSQAESLFGEMLVTYRRIERQFALPTNDLAGATAALLVGSYQAYHEETLPDAAFPALARQLRGPLAAETALAAMSEAERQAYYEQAAILGTYLVTVRIGLERAPDAAAQAHLRDAGRRYLAQALGGNPDRIVISATGMRAAP